MVLSKIIEKFSKNKKSYNKKILLGYDSIKRFDLKKNLEKYLFVIKSLI